MSVIHPTASISKECTLDSDVNIGPGCMISGKVHIGRGVQMIGNVHVSGPVTIGEGTTVYPFACIGFPGQDFKFKIGDPTAGVVIGKNAILREYATVHAATKPDKPTMVGDGVLMMCSSHVGHDARVDNRAIMVNGSALGGHSYVGEAAILSAYTCVHQFGRVGRLAMASSHVAITMDVPPFCLIAERGRMVGLNLIGLRRAGIPREQITQLRRVYRDVFRSRLTREEMLSVLAVEKQGHPLVGEWHKFILEQVRPICPGRPRRFRTAHEISDEEAQQHA